MHSWYEVSQSDEPMTGAPHIDRTFQTQHLHTASETWQGTPLVCWNEFLGPCQTCRTNFWVKLVVVHCSVRSLLRRSNTNFVKSPSNPHSKTAIMSQYFDYSFARLATKLRVWRYIMSLMATGCHRYRKLNNTLLRITLEMSQWLNSSTKMHKWLSCHACRKSEGIVLHRIWQGCQTVNERCRSSATFCLGWCSNSRMA
jgi:hypothetical protein